MGVEVLAQELMAEAVAIVLTDDELCAISFSVNRPWPTTLSTVDLAARPDFLAAIGRGMRTLMARGVLAAESSPELLVLATEPLRSNPVLTLGDVSADLLPNADGVRVMVYERSDPGCATWTAFPGGLHAFATGDRAEVIEQMADLLAARASAPGAPATSGSSDLLLTGRTPAGAQVGLVAGPVGRELTDWDDTSGRFRRANSLPSSASRDPAWWRERIEAMWTDGEASK